MITFYLFVYMCATAHVWKSEDNFRVGSLLPLCRTSGLTAGAFPTEPSHGPILPVVVGIV